MSSNPEDATRFGESEETPLPRAGVRWGGVTEVPVESSSVRPSRCGVRETPESSAAAVPECETIERRAPRRRKVSDLAALLRRLGSLGIVAALGALLGVGAIRGLPIPGASPVRESGRATEAASSSSPPPSAPAPEPSPVSPPVPFVSPNQIRQTFDRKSLRVAVGALLSGRCNEAVRELEKLPETANELEFARISKGLCSKTGGEVR